MTMRNVAILLCVLAVATAVPRLDWGDASKEVVEREREVRLVSVESGTPVLQVAYLKMSSGQDDHAIVAATQVVLHEGVELRAPIAFSTGDRPPSRSTLSSVVRDANGPRVPVGDRFGGHAVSMHVEVEYHGFHEDHHVLKLEIQGNESSWGSGFASGGMAKFKLGMRALRWGRATSSVDSQSGGALLVAVVDGATASSPGKLDTWRTYFRAGAEADLVPDQAATAEAFHGCLEQWRWYLDLCGDLGPALDAATGAFLLGDRETFKRVRDRVREDPLVLQRIADFHRHSHAHFRQGRWLCHLARLLGEWELELEMSGSWGNYRANPRSFGMAARALRWADTEDSAQRCGSWARGALTLVSLPWVIETQRLGEPEFVETEWLAVRDKALGKLNVPERWWAARPIVLAIWLLAPVLLGLILLFVRSRRPDPGTPLMLPQKGALAAMFVLCLVSVNEIQLLWLAVLMLWPIGIRMLHASSSLLDRVALVVGLMVPSCTLLASIGAYPSINQIEGLGSMAGLFAITLTGVALERDGWQPLGALTIAILGGGIGHALSIEPSLEGPAQALAIGSFIVLVGFLLQVRPPAPEPPSPPAESAAAA